MSNRMPYAEQEEIVYQWLRFRPHMTAAEATAAFRSVFAVTLTQSNFTRARKRLAALPPAPTAGKQQYLVALGTLFPTLTAKQVKAKTQLFLGEDVRDDLVTYWFTYAREFPMGQAKAARIITRTEARRASAPAFDMDTVAHPGEEPTL